MCKVYCIRNNNYYDNADGCADENVIYWPRVVVDLAPRYIFGRAARKKTIRTFVICRICTLVSARSRAVSRRRRLRRGVWSPPPSRPAGLPLTARQMNRNWSRMRAWSWAAIGASPTQLYFATNWDHVLRRETHRAAPYPWWSVCDGKS